MADAPKPANDKKPEVASSPAAAAQEADAKGAAEKLKADSTTSTSTDKPADKPAADKPAAEKSAEKPAGDSTATSEKKPEEKKEGEGKKEGEEKKEESLSERLWGFWEEHNEISEIKAALGFGDKTTEADKKALPTVAVEGDSAVAKNAADKAVVAAATDKAAPTDAKAVADAKNETDPTKKNDWGILGDVGNALAWGVSAITPDPIENVCKGAWDSTASWLGDTASWFSDTFDSAFSSAGIDKNWEKKAVYNDSVYGSDASQGDIYRVNRALQGVDTDKAYEGGQTALEKVKEQAKTDGKLLTGGADADGKVAELTGKTADQIKAANELLDGGLKGTLKTDATDAKSGAKVQIDANNNSRVENPDGSVTLKLADGTTVHRTKDGTETWFNKDKKGFIEKRADGSWEGAIGNEYRQAIGAAEVLIDLKSKFNLTEAIKAPDALRVLGDGTSSTDVDNKLIVRMDRDSDRNVFHDFKGNQYTVNQDTLQVMVKQGDQWVAVEKPPFNVERIDDGKNKGGYRIGNIEVSADGKDIDVRHKGGRFHHLHRDRDGKQIGTVEAPDPAKPGEVARIEVNSTPQEAISTDSRGDKRVINAETNTVTRTDKDGNVTLTHNFETGETKTKDIERTPTGDIRILSTDMVMRTDGSIINGDGRTIVAADGSLGDGATSSSFGRRSTELARAENAKIESDARSTSAKVQNIGAMALSIARSGDPNALGIMRHLAWAGIGMADAALGAAAGHMPAVISLSLAKGVAVSALGITNDQGRALAECNRLGIFDGSTQKEAMIAGSLGSTYITPESAALHFSADRRPKLTAVA